MLTRREFLKLCLMGMAGMSLSQLLLPEVAEALMERGERPPLIWLECDTCAGDYFSFLNTLHPNLEQFLFKMVELNYSNTSMTAEGSLAIEHLFDYAAKRHGDYILIVEGTIPTADERYSLIGHRADGKPVSDLEAVRTLADGAKYILAAGTCASFGGPYAANPNPTGSKAAYQVLRQQVINVPGCPVHPDWLMGTLSHLLLYGVPHLDAHSRPVIFFGNTIHDKCPRRTDFENSRFAKKPGDPGCSYKIGCKGPVTFSDCPTRQWICDHTNWPVEANTPCIGCVAPDFPDRMSPFFKHLPDVVLPGLAANVRTIGTIAMGGALVGVGTHFAASLISGRFKKHMLDGTETTHINPDLFREEKQGELEEIDGLAHEIAAKQTELEHKIRRLKDGRKSYSIMEQARRFFGRSNRPKSDTDKEE